MTQRCSLFQFILVLGHTAPPDRSTTGLPWKSGLENRTDQSIRVPIKRYYDVQGGPIKSKVLTKLW